MFNRHWSYWGTVLFQIPRYRVYFGHGNSLLPIEIPEVFDYALLQVNQFLVSNKVAQILDR